MPRSLVSILCGNVCANDPAIFILARCFASNPPPFADSSIIMSEAVDETRRQLLADPKAFLHRDKWMSLLQDYGQPLNETEQFFQTTNGQRPKVAS
jgi:hypothetical protein